MSSSPPPHPGSAWQQCHDQTSGYPYYWNTTTNQVRWDCPMEFRQWQISLAKPPPATLPPPKLITDVKLATAPIPEVRRNSASPPSVSTPAAVSVPSAASALVSGYDSDSEEDNDNENSEQTKSEGTPEPEAEVVEAQPDFIGPIIPKLSPSEPGKEADDEESLDPPPPGSDSEENDALLLKKLKEKSETLTLMGGDIDNAVKDIIDPENIAKIESDLADDILSQIEAEKPPDYLGQQPLFPIAAAQHSQPPQPVKPPLPLPRRPLQPSSMLQLACNYGHESDSDTEEPPGPTVSRGASSKLLPVTGQLDSLGRIVFNHGGSGSGWQTEEQKEALESYKAQSASEEKTNGVDESPPREKYEAVNKGSRKRRLALPGGRFNKADHQSEAEVKAKENVNTEFKPLAFIKSSSVIPGTINETEKQNVEMEKKVDISQANGDLVPLDVSSQATELVEKLEYFKVGEEKVSSLKTLAIKLETLYSAWSAGALSLPYLNIVLQNAKKKIEEAEINLDTPPWKAFWDRDKRTYSFKNELNGKENNDEKEVSITPPPGSPPPLPSESKALDRPPLPPPDAPRPAPPPSADHQLQDMEIDDEQTVNITDELSNFYSEIEQSTPNFTPVPDKHLDEANNSSSSTPNSAPGSPGPPEIKKRKKVKVSNSISLKKKGVGDMLAKWQKINN